MGLLLGASIVTVFEVMDLILFQYTVWRNKSQAKKANRSREKIIPVTNFDADTRL